MTYRPAYYQAPHALSPAVDGDAGIDLPCSLAAQIFPGEWRNINCDVRVALPPGTFAFVMARSSTFFQKHLMVNTAVIDEGYRGELFVCVYNIGTRKYNVEVGERLAQLVIMPRIIDQVDMIKIEDIDLIGTTRRGVNGFGSTG